MRDETLVAKGGFASQQTVDNEQAQVDALKASIAGDAAAIETARINLDYTTIRAPFSGVPGLRNVDLGNVVSPGTNILTLAQIEPIAVDFTLPQADLAVVKAALKGGEPAVTAYDQDGTTSIATGSVEVLNNQLDPTTGTIKLKARFENTDGIAVARRVRRDADRRANAKRTRSSCRRRQSSTVPRAPMSGESPAMRCG